MAFARYGRTDVDASRSHSRPARRQLAPFWLSWRSGLGQALRAGCLVSGLRPVIMCVPRPPWGLAAARHWPCAGCPSAPKGLPHPSAPRQQQNSFLLCYQISSCLRTLFGGYRPFRPVSQRHAGLLMLAQHLFAGVCKIQQIVLHLPLHSAPNKKPCYRLDSRVSMCHKAYLAPRPGLEPGTYGLTVGSIQQVTNHCN